MLCRYQVSVVWIAALVVVATATVTTAEPTTTADFNTHFREWVATKLQAEFKAHGQPSAPWAGDLERFFAAFAASYTSRFDDEAANERLDALAAAVAKAGCDDPLFLACQAPVAVACRRARQAEAALQPLADKVRAAGYSTVCVFFATLWLRTARGELGVTKNPPEFSTAVAAAATDPALTGDDKLIYIRTLLPYDDDVLAMVADQFAKPDSSVDPWVKAVATGRSEIRKAWAARGRGFAHKVKPQGWQGFEEHLALARQALLAAHEMHPEWPDAATELISVSMGDRTGEERLWFDRAVAAEFDHESAYRRLGTASLQPRWGGSHEAMLAFGRECLDTGRFDTFVPGFVFDVALAVGADLTRPRDAFAMPGVYDDCLRAANGYLKAAGTTPAVARLWRSRLAVLQWATGRHHEAARVLDELEDDPAPQALSESRVRLEELVGESRLFGGPCGDAAKAAEALIAAGKLDAARAAYESLAAAKDTPAAARQRVTGRIATLNMTAALDRSEWVDLQPPPDLAGWRVVSGEWKVEPDGTLVANTSIKSRSTLVCEATIGQDIEVALECDLGQRPAGQNPVDGCSLMLARDEATNRTCAVVAGGIAQRVWVNNGSTNAGSKEARVEIKPTSTLRAVLWDGKISVFFNDKKVFDRVEVPPGWLAGDRLALGDFAYAQPKQLRIRKLRVRKLDQAPADF